MLAHITEPPLCTSVFKRSPEDFCVEEILGFEPDGEGDQVFLFIEKRQLNTEDIVQKLQRFADVKNVDIGYSGLKDRNALTRQWFSVKIAEKIEPDWSALENENIRCLTVSRHKRKLRKGTHRANRFTITLCNITGDLGDLQQRLTHVQDSGVPNYFGEQRFGRNQSNITQAEKMFNGSITVKSRHKRGLYLSAVRSMLFNEVLSHRVSDGSWEKVVKGELLILDGTHSYFQYEQGDTAIAERIERGDVHPSGPMWGQLDKERSKFNYQNPIFELEESVLSRFEPWREGLEQAGMKYDRRSLRLVISDMSWNFIESDKLQLQFSLPSGSYATTVLRELTKLM